MITSVQCGKCNEEMGTITYPSQDSGSTTTGNIPVQTTYYCKNCKISITITDTGI